jgi:hypothetical protein
MVAGLDFSVGTQGLMMDGDIFFGHREAQKRFFRSGYSVRYRYSETFESIEFGLSNDYWFYRCRPSLVFRAKSQLMYGFNRWNDVKTADHKIWDAFIINYSLSQSLIYDPLDKRSIVLGLGLVEDLYYVYSKSAQFQLGLLVNLGFKL